MATQGDINRDLYSKFNACKAEQAETNGYLKAIVEQNDKLIRQNTRALYIIASFGLICLFALIYGAIGKEGLHSVRQSLPAGVPKQTAAIPCPDDGLDKWRTQS